MMENLNPDTLNENAGLPSVNRRRGNNKLVTLLGFLFIIGVAAASIVAVNKDNAPAPRKAVENKVANTLPPIVFPEPKPPAPPVVVKPSAPPVLAAEVKPINPPPKDRPLDWYERKRIGGLVLDVRQTGPQTNATAAVTPVSGAGGLGSGSSGLAGFGAGTAGSSGSDNGLAARLAPTVTKAAAASLLPDRRFLITKGTSLDCVLETAIDSSVPGITTCRLTRDIYSDNGQVLLLERGSRLVGEYQSGLKVGQVRAFVLWTRATTPNGVAIALDSPGADGLGRSGLEGWVDNHFRQRFGAAILTSVVKDGVAALANNTSGDGNTTNYYGNAAASGEKITEKILDSTVNIPPTIIKNQGDPIQVMVARDLDFSGVYQLRLEP